MMIISKFINRYSSVILFLIILLGAFFRFYKLSEFPVQLSHDEVSQFYDAISVLKTGEDIHNQDTPFIFKSIGDYKPPFYTYATIPIIFLFGESEVVIRIAGGLFGTFLIFAVYLFTEKLFSNKYIALISAFFTAIAPFEIHYSRKSFEGQAGELFLLLGFTLFIGYLRNNKENKKFILGSIWLGLALYTYFSFTILIPIFYLAFLILMILRKKIIPKAGVLAFLFVIIPLIFFIIRDQGSINRIKSVSITQDSTLERILSDRENYNDFKKEIIIVRYSLTRYLDQLNPTFLFINGLDLTNQDPIDMGPFYFFQMPLIIVGFVYMFSKFGKKKELLAVILILISIGLLPSGLSFERHSPHRILIVLTLLNIISAFGLYQIIKYIYKKINSIWIKYVMVIASLLFFIWNFGYFIFIYTISFPIDKSEFIQYPFREVAQVAEKYYDEYDLIIFDPRFGKDMPWIGAAAEYYLAYYGNYPVEKMQREFKMDKSGTTFGKYVVRDIYWPEDMKLKNTLVIASPWVISRDSFGDAELIKEVKSYQGTTTTFFVLSLK